MQSSSSPWQWLAILSVLTGACALDTAPLEPPPSRGDAVLRTGEDGGEELSLEVTTLARGDQRIVVIDMVHAAPHEFYRSIHRLLAPYDLDSTVLTAEGVDCRGPFADISHFGRIPVEALPRQPDIEQRYAAVQRLDIGPLIESGAVRWFDCAEKQIPPSFRAIGADHCAVRGSLTCQAENTWLPTGFEIVPGDIDLAEITPGEMLLLSAWLQNQGFALLLPQRWAFIGWLLAPGLRRDGTETTLVELLFEKVLLQRRNEAAFTMVDAALAAGTRTVLLPWGAMHSPGLVELARQRGFVEIERRPVFLGRCRLLETLGDGWRYALGLSQMCEEARAAPRHD
jgi:hypothetical protein